MILPQTAEYALRAMAYLALLEAGRTANAQTVSEGTGIPTSYLSKVLRKLVLAKLLRSQKGHGGGFSLARPAERITFRDVLDAVDFGVDSARCAFGWEACDPEHPCPLHPSWSELKEDFEQWARATTLANVRRQASRRGPRTS